MSKNIFLIRHGEPQSHLHNGQLTPFGVKQANKISNLLNNELKGTNPVVVVSPTKRTVETSQPFCELKNIRPIFNSQFTEEYLVDSHISFLSPQFLSHHMSATDILKAFWKVVHAYPNQPIVFFTHGNVIRIILGKLQKLSFEKMCEVKVEVGSITKITLDDKDNINETSYVVPLSKNN